MNLFPDLEGLVVQGEEDLLVDVGDIFGEEFIEATVLGGGSHGERITGVVTDQPQSVSLKQGSSQVPHVT